MKLFEHEGKQIFSQWGIPIPRGGAVGDIHDARRVAGQTGYPVVVKSQVLRGGRGKAGGIKFASGEAELDAGVKELLAMRLAGEPVETVLVEEKLNIASEFYMGITLDPKNLSPLLMVSAQGGMDIEQVAKESPHQVFKAHLHPLQKPGLHSMLDLLLKTGLRGKELVRAATVLLKLVRCYFDNNAITAEINPLVIDAEGNVIAADAKVEIDDNALFRVKAAAHFTRKEEVADPLEAEAKSMDISYVGLGGGNIGLIAGGAGLGMASMDMIAAHGGKPANFLDLGGDATMEKTARALRIVLKAPGVRGVLINLFGGINNCEQMAKGISQVVDDLKPSQTVVVKMRGHSQEEGWSILADKKIPVIKMGTTEEAVLLLLQEMNRQGVTVDGCTG